MTRTDWDAQFWKSDMQTYDLYKRMIDMASSQTAREILQESLKRQRERMLERYGIPAMKGL